MAIEACPTCTPRLTTATAAFCDHCAARLPKDTPFADNHGTLLCQACAPAQGVREVAVGTAVMRAKGTGVTKEQLTKGRAVCPACGRKGLGYARHAHAFGYKDYDRASCRYCNKTFKRREKNTRKGEAG